MYTQGITASAIRAANAANEGLAHFESYFFWEQEECADGYMSGGRLKYTFIKAVDLPAPIQFNSGPDGRSTPLAILLEKLYALLREHYSAINEADLARFKVEKKPVQSQTVPDREEQPPPSEQVADPELPPTRTVRYDPLARVNARRGRERADLEQTAPHASAGASTSGTAVASSSASSTSAQLMAPTSKRPALSGPFVASTERPRRRLDTHKGMITAFEGVLFENEAATVPRDLSLYNRDKGIDQLDGLQSAQLRSDKNASGSLSGLAQGKSQGSKAGSTEHWRLSRLRGYFARVANLGKISEDAEEEAVAEQASRVERRRSRRRQRGV